MCWKEMELHDVPGTPAYRDVCSRNESSPISDGLQLWELQSVRALEVLVGAGKWLHSTAWICFGFFVLFRFFSKERICT